MRAAVITGRGTVEVREVPDPIPIPGGVVVDIAMCGICGTDVAAFAEGSPYNPAICGHEWTGTISAVGEGVRRVAEGDRVVVSVPTACGTCAACRAGLPDSCQYVQQVAIGMDDLAPGHGGFAPRLGVAEGRVAVLDGRLDDVQAAQVEPASVAYHAVRGSGLRLGDLAVVLGAGSIGLLVLQLVRIAGARHVVSVEPNPARRALALCLGADSAVAPAEISDHLGELTNGLGADVVFECSGRGAGIQEGVELARRDGTMCMVGLSHGTASISPHSWLRRQITVRVSQGFSHADIDVVMGLVGDGRISFEGIHTATVGIGGLAAALTDLQQGETENVKVLVDPSL